MTEKLSDISPYLYHYTNEQGLKGILENQCLLATHYKFLNDFSEIVLFKEKLRELIYSCTFEFYNKIIPEYPNSQEIISTNGGLEAMVKHDSEVFVDSSYETLAREIYIASFCTKSEDKYTNENGILSQWRAYGGDGGFAIVLNTEGLEKMLDSEYQSFHYDGLLLGDVVYSSEDEKYKLEFTELLPHITAYQQEMFEQVRLGVHEPPNIELSTNACNSLIQCFTRYKHRGFKEEHEARIVAMPLALPNSEIIEDNFYKSKLEKDRKFRNKNGIQIPYIELFRSLDERLPIEKIIVGPHKDKELRAAALRIMLRNTIKVTVSEIPYIN
ncbi:MAG: DUF2971 domain-containing protein [Methyloglobulus sp.]